MLRKVFSVAALGVAAAASSPFCLCYADLAQVFPRGVVRRKNMRAACFVTCFAVPLRSALLTGRPLSPRSSPQVSGGHARGA